MKKKLISATIIVLASIAIFAPAQKAEAQPIYGSYCCDGNGVRRCVLDNLYLLNSPCVCYQQGSGYVCL